MSFPSITEYLKKAGFSLTDAEELNKLTSREQNVANHFLKKGTVSYDKQINDEYAHAFLMMTNILRIIIESHLGLNLLIPKSQEELEELEKLHEINVEIPTPYPYQGEIWEGPYTEESVFMLVKGIVGIVAYEEQLDTMISPSGCFSDPFYQQKEISFLKELIFEDELNKKLLQIQFDQSKWWGKSKKRQNLQDEEGFFKKLFSFIK